MEGEGGVSRSIIDELNSGDLQVDQMEDESGLSQSIIHETDSSDVE